jgi:hypothetical protein
VAVKSFGNLKTPPTTVGRISPDDYSTTQDRVKISEVI